MRTTLRISVLTAICLSTSTGVVMASSTGCRVAVVEQLRYAQAAMHRRAHHSAATLARWKIGTAAWSKAHGGKLYAGSPARGRPDWVPLRFTCEDVALDLNRPDEGLMVTGETPPEFAGYDGLSHVEIGPDMKAATQPPVEDGWERASVVGFGPVPFGGSAGTGAGNALDGPVGPASFPPAPLPAPLATPVPAPEPPTVILLATGMLSFLVSKLRRRTVV